MPFAGAAGAAGAVTARPAPTDYASAVNPFIGTQGDHGQDGPGAIAPYGLATVTPTTTNGNHVGYEYTSRTLLGFTNVALDGVGGGGGAGDVLVVPTYRSYTSRPATSSYAKSIRTTAGVKDESASAGYYQVGLDEDGKDIDAQVTAATRTGVHDYAFGTAGHVALVVDLQHTGNGRRAADLTVGTSADGRTTLSGSFTGYFYNSAYRLYYYAETTVPTSSVQTWGADGLSSAVTSREGTDIGAVLNVDASAGEHVGLRVTLSPVSAEQARRDAGVEVAGRSFDEVRRATVARWNERLGMVDVEASATNDPTGDLRTQFYTHLYRLADTPMNATSTDGTYRGADGAIYQAEGYTHYDSWSLWDDFHKYAAVASVYPDVYRDVVQSLVDLYAQVGTSGASVGSLLQSVPTVRWERAPVVVADAISKGVELQGLAQAYPALVAQVGSPASLTNLDSRAGGLLGYSYDADGLAVIADAIGKRSDAERYRAQAARWAKAFDVDALAGDARARAATGAAEGVDEVGLLMPRASNSESAAFAATDPEKWEAAGLYQGTLWQYSWYDAQDLGGLVEMMGGKERAARAVSYFFGTYTDDCSRTLHLYANEISVHAPFLFNYVGEPAQTQDLTYRMLTEPVCTRYTADGSSTSASKKRVYQNTPDGLLETMDNDAGTMSGYFVSGALGLYPVKAGGDTFQITSPLFDRTTLHRPGGADLVIEAPGVSATNHYIQAVTLDGHPLRRTWLTAAELASGGVLHVTMGPQPTSWGADGIAEDSANDHVSSLLYHPDAPVSTSSRVFEESGRGDGSVDGSITLSSAGTPFAGADGADVTSAIEASGLPRGLRLEARKTGDRTIDLTLRGRAARHLVDDSTDGVVVRLRPAAFAGAAPAATDRTVRVRVRFRGFEISPSTTTLTAGAHGVVRSTVELRLRGGVTFAGRGHQALRAGAITFPGLDRGVTARVTRTGDTTARIAFSGRLRATSTTHFTLRLTDAALRGAQATEVAGAGATPLHPFTLAPRTTTRAELRELTDDAGLVTPDAYSSRSYDALRSAVDRARSVLADRDASQYTLSAALAVLRHAADGLEIVPDGYRTLQAEDHDVSSGGTLKTENGGSGAVVGGVAPGSWLGYRGLDLSAGRPVSVVIDYSHNPGTASASSAVELRTGSSTGPLVTTVDLPTTGGWSSFTAVTHTFTADEAARLSGRTDLYLVFTGALAPGKSWVANVDWFRLTSSAEAEPTSTRVELESVRAGFGPLGAPGTGLVAGTDYSGADLKTEAGGSGGQLAGTKDGSWVRYPDVNLGGRHARTLSVRYDAPTSRVADGRLAFYLDEAPSAGSEPLVTVPLPATGSGWGTYATTTVTLPAELTGRHTIFVELRSTPTASQPYVGNLDWFSLGYVVDKDALRAALTRFAGLTRDADRYLATDFAVLERAYAAAQRVEAADDATAAEVTDAVRVLTTAAENLRWKVVKQTEALLDEARSVERGDVTAASWARLRRAVVAAERLDPATSSHRSYVRAEAALRAAIEHLRPAHRGHGR